MAMSLQKSQSESPESPMDLDIFQKVPKGRKNRNHDHWEVDLDKLVLRRVHRRSRKVLFAASSLPMPEEQLVGFQRTYYVDAVDERSVDEIPRDQFKVHVSEPGASEQMRSIGKDLQNFPSNGSTCTMTKAMPLRACKISERSCGRP